MLFDTGATNTVVASAFARAARLHLKPLLSPRSLRLANGATAAILGTCDVPMYLQLMLQEENGQLVNWDRYWTLQEVAVADLGDEPARSMFVGWRDWKFNPRDGAPVAPLANLAFMMMAGAQVFNSPRVPMRKNLESTRVVFTQEEELSVAVEEDTPSDASLREDIEARIEASQRGTPWADALVRLLLENKKVLGPLISEECTQVIDFTVTGDPIPCSFKVKLPRHVSAEAVQNGLSEWVSRGFMESVPWSTRAYGFVIITPKRDGSFRITINPSGVNKATARVSPDGGFMPDNLVNEVQRLGRPLSVAMSLDLADAFMTLKLGPTAQELSVFTSPFGKYRMRHAFFGWHSFPSVFQTVIMEHVVLPTLDECGGVEMLAWIDDIVLAAKEVWTLLDAFKVFLAKLLAMGGRLKLAKSQFFVTVVNWCGMQIDFKTNNWRIDPERVEALARTPVPRDAEALKHIISVLRYYYFGVTNQVKQRERIARLAALADTPRVDIESALRENNKDLMRVLDAALKEVMAGKWLLVYDATKPVWVWTDASSECGFAIVAAQWDTVTGALLPISYFSKGWETSQWLGWTPQVKEMYAARVAMTKVMPTAFPYAMKVYLLLDNKNIASNAASEDRRILRWQAEIRDTGCVELGWTPGEYNTIADFGSRSVTPSGEGMSADEAFDARIYAILSPVEEKEGLQVAAETVVPGHLPMDSTVAKIAAAQQAASEEERAGWRRSRNYSTVTLGGQVLHLLERRLIVPSGALELKGVLLRLAHDDDSHYSGADRTVLQLKRQARVYWEGMDTDVAKYIASCFKCQFAKAPHHEAKNVGTLVPTIPPYVYHTGYADLKGPMPSDTGYLLVLVEGISKAVRIRYVPRNTAGEVTEELEEAFGSWGTYPKVLRTDGGPPFNSVELAAWAKGRGITTVLGVAEHHQGQGTVETKMRGLATAIIATLGGKAPTGWFKDPRMLMRLEQVINSTYTSAHGGCPGWVLTGREPRTLLSATTSDVYDATEVLGIPGATADDVSEIIAQHHDQIDKVQGRARMAVCLAQALSKARYDGRREPASYKEGDWVLVYNAAPNRMTPHYTGPYKVVEVRGEGNFVLGRHYLTPEAEPLGPFHVSRLIRFDFTRTTPGEIAQFELGEGAGIVSEVKGHRLLPDGTYEFEVEFVGNPVPFWLRGYEIRRVRKAVEYCERNHLPSLGSLPKRVAGSAAGGPRASRSRKGSSS